MRALFGWLLLALALGSTAAGELRGPEPGIASHPTPAFDRDGRLWLAFERGDHIYVTSSDDFGKSFDLAVVVNAEPEPMDANGEGRPNIAAMDDGTLLVTWTRKLDAPYTGLIRLSRSTDGGRSFSTPRTVNDDGLVTGHRFDALAVAPSGKILVAWIDKRDLEHALAEGTDYAGAAIYTALSRDGGESFEPNRKLKDHVCECCRLSFGFDRSGKSYLLFRDLMAGGIRDHSLARGVAGPNPAEIQRVSFDDWKIDACPHHGPSLWIDGSDAQHVVWFSAGERSGIGSFYARSDDGGRTFSNPMRLGDENATHPFVLGVGRDVYLVWLEATATASVVRSQSSADSGESWTEAVTVALGAPGADHPLLVRRGEDVFLSWFTKDAGYRLRPLSGSRASQ